jgi:CubicO group peptidase (beta-lactamase class C family)
MSLLATSTQLHASDAPRGLARLLKSEMQARRIPGMQVAVVRHGQVVLLEALGFADVEHHVRVTEGTVFPLASATKAFTGVALMQLVEDGKLDLDAPVSRYLEGLPQAWQAVTVRQLATHVSGLPSIMDNNSAALIVPHAEPEASWAKVQTLPMESAPGTRYSYNQTNYLLLGKIIDALAGEPLAHFIQRRQLDVAGMRLTRYGDDRDVIENRAPTYSFMRMSNGRLETTDRLSRPYVEFPDFLRAAAGLNSTALDIAHWIIALQQGRLLAKRASLTALWTPTAIDTGSAGFQPAIGWPANARARHPVYAPAGGMKAVFGVYPDDDLAVVILTNLQGGLPEQLLDKVAAFFF